MNTSETKPWWASKSIIGSGITVLAVVAGIFGVQVDPASQAVIVDQVVAITSAASVIVGAGLSIYGRITAKKPIG